MRIVASLKPQGQLRAQFFLAFEINLVGCLLWSYLYTYTNTHE